MNDAWAQQLAAAAKTRVASGLHRTLRPRGEDDGVLDLASNDYLGLAHDPRVVEAAVEATRKWGAGSTGSRLVTGTTTLHADLEAELADFCASESALVCSSGYTANLAAVAGLAGPGDLLVSDAANHASLIDACRVSRARVVVTSSGDTRAVRQALEGRRESRALVVSDAAFSTNGSLARIADLYAVCHDAGAMLLVDEAHSLGVHGDGGRGLVHHVGLAERPDVVRTVTLSKSLGSQGGAILANRMVIEHLVNTARAFIFDTGLAPGSVGAALGALRVLQSEADLPRRLLDRAKQIARLLDVPAPASAVVPVVIGDAAQALAAAQACRDEGVHVGCFRPPSVPVGTSRLRLTARATLTSAEIEHATDVVRRAVAGQAARENDRLQP